MQGTGSYSGSSKKYKIIIKNCTAQIIKLSQAEKFNKSKWANVKHSVLLRLKQNKKIKKAFPFAKRKAQTKKLQHDNKYERANKYCQGGWQSTAPNQEPNRKEMRKWGKERRAWGEKQGTKPARPNRGKNPGVGKRVLKQKSSLAKIAKGNYKSEEPS